MNGEMALAIALTTYGNVYLASSPDTKPPELFGTHSTFRYVGSIAFQDSERTVSSSASADAHRRTEGGRSEEPSAAGGTASWYLRLRRLGTTRLWISKLPYQLELPEVLAAAFADTVLWGIHAEYANSSSIWSVRWKHEGGHGRARPWKVHVYESFATSPEQHPHAGLESVADSLRTVLRKALDFSTRAKLDFFPADFSQSLALLDSKSPEIPYHPDLLPASRYPLLARQVVASAAKAWVFGGMGSFNDLGFDSPALEEEYNSLLPTLYGTVVGALLAGANSFEPP